jgi:hypothetical protein
LDSRPPLHAAAVGALFVLGAATLPGSALAAASFEAFAFAALSVTPDQSITALGGAIDDDTSGTATAGNASAQILVDQVFAFDEFTLQDAGVAGEALPSVGGFSSADAFVTSSTSLTFANSGSETANIAYELDYSADVFAALDDPALDAAGASASILFGTIDFGTGIQTTLLEEILDLVTSGQDSVLSAITGSVPVAGNSFVGFFVDIAVEGLAITTEQESGPALPVPATLLLVGSGLLGLGLQRRRRAAVAEAEQAF